MQEKLTFNDVLISPKFNTIQSRKDVDLTSDGIFKFKLPLISANMDTITEVSMAKAMNEHGAVGALHRFCSIEDNIKMYLESSQPTFVSLGLGDKELERAESLFNNGATSFLVDVAHGAQQSVVDQIKKLNELIRNNAKIVVGNFANYKSLLDFFDNLGFHIDGIKVGIGNGASCSTRLKTGIGVPQLSAIQDCYAYTKTRGIDLVADGGVKTPGDVAKALAAGANMVMTGFMLAGTDEAGGTAPTQYIVPKGSDITEWSFLEQSFKIQNQQNEITFIQGKNLYRGSASKESYDVQGKDESWRTAEGESFAVEYKGPVSNVLKDIEGGLRSALTYTGSSNLTEFRNNAEFIRITNNGYIESTVHGKN